MTRAINACVANRATCTQLARVIHAENTLWWKKSILCLSFKLSIFDEAAGAQEYSAVNNIYKLIHVRASRNITNAVFIRVISEHF